MSNEQVKNTLKIFEEQLKEHRKPLHEWRDKAFKELSEANKSRNGWILAIITLSSAILGLGASSLLNSAKVNNPYLLYAGMLIMGLNVIVGLFFSKKPIEAEIDDLALQLEYIRKLEFYGVDKVRAKIVETGGNQEEYEGAFFEWIREIKDYIDRNIEGGNSKKTDKPKRNYLTDILWGGLTIALILIALSLAPLCNDKTKPTKDVSEPSNENSRTVELSLSKTFLVGATGRSAQVWYDYQSGKSVPIPESLRKILVG